MKRKEIFLFGTIENPREKTHERLEMDGLGLAQVIGGQQIEHADVVPVVDSSELLYPWEFYDKRAVKQILTEDMIQLRKKKWPLVPLTDFKYCGSPSLVTLQWPHRRNMFDLFYGLTSIQKENPLYPVFGYNKSTSNASEQRRIRRWRVTSSSHS